MALKDVWQPQRHLDVATQCVCDGKFHQDSMLAKRRFWKNISKPHFVSLGSGDRFWPDVKLANSIYSSLSHSNFCGLIGRLQGRRLQVRGPIWNTSAGSHSVVCRNFWGGALRRRLMTEISDVAKAMPEKVTPRSLQQRIQLTVP